MKAHCLLLLAGWGLVAVSGCVTFRDRVVDRSQSIEVTSEPPGASITVVDENGSRSLGQAPTTYVGTFTVNERTYDKATCAMAGAATGASIVDDGDGINSEGEAVVNLIALVAGAAAGAAECREADGVVAVRSSQATIRAELPGYRPEQVQVSIPKREPRLHFELQPLGAATYRRSGPVSSRETSGQTYRLAVFNIVDTSGSIAPELLADVSQATKTALMSLATLAGQVVDGDAALATRGIRTLTEKQRRLEAARTLGAAQMLDVRLVRRGEVCYLTATITSSSGADQLLSSQQADCDEDGLYSASERIVELLAYPPHPPAAGESSSPGAGPA